MAIIIGPMEGSGFVIRDIWAAVVVHSDSDEAIPGVMVGGVMCPLIAADPKRLEWLKEQARIVSRDGRVTIRIVKFTTREDLEVIKWGQ